MFNALSSLLNKTIDVFLKINSAEGRRRKFSKDVFGVYSALCEIACSLDAIATTVKAVAGIHAEGEDTIERDHIGQFRLPAYVIARSWSSDGMVEIQTRELAPDGTESLSLVRSVHVQSILPAILSSDIQVLNRSVRALASIMQAESWDLFQLQHQPAKLRALGIFDDDIIPTFTRAWFADGGFVEALRRLGLDQDIDKKVLRLVDATFDPETSPHGYAVRGDVAQFSLESRDDIAALLELAANCKKAVERSRDVMKNFIAKNCAIEDVL